MVAIIDYDAGNIRSVEKAVLFLGEEAVVTGDRDRILSADRCILPGVGAFGDAMEKLSERGLIPVIKEYVWEKKAPFLGICLGMQVLFEKSEESPGVNGLGLLKGEVLKIPEGEGLKVPHIGWNSLSYPHEGALFDGIEEGEHVYFVHSYYVRAGEEEVVKARTGYGVQIDASVQKDSLFGCQFHPEKSGAAGLKILENFLKYAH